MSIYYKSIPIKSIIEIKRIQSQLIPNIAAQKYINLNNNSKINLPKINFINIFKP